MNSTLKIEINPKRRTDTIKRLNKHRIPKRKWRTTKMGLSADQAVCIHYDVPTEVGNYKY